MSGRQSERTAGGGQQPELAVHGTGVRISLQRSLEKLFRDVGMARLSLEASGEHE